MSQSSSTARLQFELSREKLDELDRLMIEGGFATKKELFSNAIALLQWALKHTQEGHAVAAVDEKSKKYFELQMPFLAHAASKRGTSSR